MKTDRKHVLTVSAALVATTLTFAGCSREVGNASADEAARSAAEATGAARSAVDELVDTNNALLLRVDELESRLATAEGGRVERTSAPAVESSYSAEPSRRIALRPCRRGTTRAR